MELTLASLVNESLSRLRLRLAATPEIAASDADAAEAIAGQRGRQRTLHHLAVAIVPALNGVGSSLKAKFTTITPR
jgi:hypothetical protein